MSRPAWRGVVVVVGLVPDDRAMRVIWRFRPADRANCNQNCGVVVARFSRVGQDGRNPWRCWIDLQRLHHLSIYQATTVREIVACPRMHVLGVTAVPGRYSSWMVLNPLKCRVARLNINHSLYQPRSVGAPFPSGNSEGLSTCCGGYEGEEATWAIDRAKNLIGSPSDSRVATRFWFVSAVHGFLRFHCQHRLS